MRQSLILLLICLTWIGCKRETRVESGNRDQILHLGNGNEIEGVDPHTCTGVTEHNVISALFEGLLGEDPNDLTPVPGVAERWEVSEDLLTYTFHLRKNAKWSNGDPVTAHDFIGSWKRILTPTLAAEYASMLFPVKNAEAYYKGEVKDFAQVGAKAVDDYTVVLNLKAPTPYLLGMIANHYSWSPVPISVVEKFGGMDKKGTKWTDPENIICNGPFVLTDRRLNHVTVVKQNPHYWDKDNVTLKEIHYYPIESRDTEERAFRNGQLHATYELIPEKIAVYKKDRPEALRIDPYLGVYFYRLNTTVDALKDKRVRKALAMTIDRESIVQHVSKGEQIAAYSYVPLGTAGYEGTTRITNDLEKAKQLLADAGFPDGKGFPTLEIHFNTDERHKAIAESIHQMWKKALNIEVTMVNHEWKVYLDTQDALKYDVSRSGWIGDYLDPNTFLSIFMGGDGNNDTGWANAEYDGYVRQASETKDPKLRYELFQKAEAIMLDEMPLIPIFFYTKPYNLHPSVKGWGTNLLGHRPYKHIRLE